MSKKPDNPPAFARPYFGDGHGEYSLEQVGMSLRDWFAGQVIAAMSTSAGFDGAPWEKLAADAYQAADAMLARRIKAEG